MIEVIECLVFIYWYFWTGKMMFQFTIKHYNWFKLIEDEPGMKLGLLIIWPITMIGQCFTKGFNRIGRLVFK